MSAFYPSARNPRKLLLLLAALLTVFSLLPSGPVGAQSRSPAKVVIKVRLRDRDQAIRLVQNFGLVVQKVNNESPGAALSSLRVKTTTDGSVYLSLVPGDYIVSSENPLIVEGNAYEWSIKLKVGLGEAVSLELNNDNATITQADEALKQGRITDEADLLKVLGDGVVNVQGELGQGTGFIVASTGLIVTNQHVIAKSKELRVQFDGGRKVVAKLLAEDSDLDLAALWVNLAACLSCKALKLAEPKPEAGPAIEAAWVLTISSPLDQSKTTAAGTLKQADEHTIKIDANNSGAPLFNSVGEVIGILKFVDQSGSRPGASGVITIEEAQAVIAKAKDTMKDASNLPSADLLPIEPEDSYPAEALKNLVDVKAFKAKPYEVDIGKYQMTIITPPLKYYITERNRVALERQQKKSDKSGTAATPVVTNSFRDLRNWANYVNQMRPVVHLLVIPEVSATVKSTFFSLLSLGVGILLPPDFKFKADFGEMSLTCDGKQLTAIQRGRIEFVTALQSYFKTKQRNAYAGLYTYSADTFDPGKCKQLNLRVVSEQNPTVPEIKLIDPKTIQKVWSDFEPYRQQMTGKH